MRCYECGWSKLSRMRNGETRCQRCGTKAPVSSIPTESTENVSAVAKLYTGVLIAFSLVFPFLLPFILAA